jgi:hypothetical protein
MSAFNGIRVFSATMAAKRATIGEDITQWLGQMRDRPGFEIVDVVVRQSSDAAFHCLTYVFFFRETVSAKRRGT